MAAGAAASLPLEDQWPSPPTRRAPIAPTEEQLRQEPWYHGQMSRRAAEKLLRADGDFLVRDSVTNPGQYVLTGMHAGQPKHLLLVDPEGVVRGTRRARGRGCGLSGVWEPTRLLGMGGPIFLAFRFNEVFFQVTKPFCSQILFCLPNTLELQTIFPFKNFWIFKVLLSL